LRVGVDLAAPLSLASGGLAGRSARERGGRPPCTASSLGVFLGRFGVLSRSPSPASSGGVGQRWDPLPRRRPWRAAAGAGSDLGFFNKPGSGRSGLGGQGRKGLSRCRRGDGMGRVPAAPVLGRLDLEQRCAESSRSTPFAGHGGRGRSCSATLLSRLGAAVFLLLPPLLAGLGGEGQGTGRGDAADVWGSSVEVFGCDTSRFAPLCFAVPPWWRRPESLPDVKPSPNKRCCPWVVCWETLLTSLAGLGGEGEGSGVAGNAFSWGCSQVLLVILL
jgi:hypothetical protein